jgi:sterol 3beta-glucosyltransferase
MGAITHEHAAELIDDYMRETEGADVLVANMLTEDWLVTVAEARRLPFLALHLAPLRRTDHFAHPLATTRTVPFRFLRRLTHDLVETMWWKGFAPDVNVFRARLGLDAVKTPTPRRLRASGVHTLHAFSPSILPQPPDWDASQPVLGMIRFPDEIRARVGEAEPPAELGAWLEAGTAPVFLGLGSMPVEDPAAMVEMVDRVARELGVRAVIGAGWSRLDVAQALPDHLRIVGAVDHGWLFPRCQAIVHHGGAGTLHASLGAGRPTVVCSVFADQPFWGARVEALGVGAHVPFAKLTQQRLAAALKRALAPGTRAAAARLGEAIRSEADATAAIADRIEALVP